MPGLFINHEKTFFNGRKDRKFCAGIPLEENDVVEMGERCHRRYAGQLSNRFAGELATWHSDTISLTILMLVRNTCYGCLPNDSNQFYSTQYFKRETKILNMPLMRTTYLFNKLIDDEDAKRGIPSQQKRREVRMEKVKRNVLKQLFSLPFTFV